MKLSFTTLGCPDWGFEKILDEAQRIGFDGIEIRGIDGKMRADEIKELSQEQALNTLALLKDRRLEWAGFGASVRFDDDAKRADFLSEGKSAIDVCQRMGIPFIRVFGDSIDKETPRETVFAKVISGIGELCAYANGKNVQILMETHGDYNSTETLLPIIEGLKDMKNFGILWDIEHSDKTYGEQWPAFYEKVKPFVRHIHVKDYLRVNPQKNNKQFDLCLVGEGDIPIAAIVKTLLADGYDGYFSLEWEKKWNPELPEPEIAFPGYYRYMKGLNIHE